MPTLVRVSDGPTALLSLHSKISSVAEAVGQGRDDALLAELAKAAQLSFTGSPQDFGAISALMAPTNDRAMRRFLAVVLAHLLSRTDGFWSASSEFRVSSIKLFDDVFGDDIYKALKLEPRQQTFEKLERLRSAVPEAMSVYQNAMTEPPRFASLNSLQSDVLRALSNPLVSGLIAPVVPRGLLAKTSLRELFLAIDEFGAAEGMQIVGEYERVSSLLNDLLAETNKFIRIHYVDLLAQMLTGVRSEVDSSFQTNPANAPAHVAVRATEKKYPLHLDDEPIVLAIEVLNSGPGQAFDVEIAIDAAEGIHVPERAVYLGGLSAGRMIASLPARTSETPASSSPEVLGTCSWRDFSGEVHHQPFLFELRQQRSDLQWEELEGRNPYALEPIEEEARLVGRSTALKHLEALADSPAVGSAYIFGQKRVGKTSIAKTLKTALESHEHAHIVIYLDAGDYVRASASDTIAALGSLLCEEIAASTEALGAIEIPSFSDALSPLSDFIRRVGRTDPNFRATFILDEFDELPLELYRRSTIGDAFFLTLKAVSSKPNWGFVLVGGEKMEMILSSQGENLNKFQQIRVDYFDRTTQWHDYSELVRGPVEDWLEITDEAVNCLYDASAGNPYFTNLICADLAAQMIAHRDCHATQDEVEQAISTALLKAGIPSFMHFWEDAIFDTGPAAEAVSLRRRKALLAWAHCKRERGTTMTDDVVSDAHLFGLESGSASGELTEFVRRGVLVGIGGAYACRVNLFERWLVDRGFGEIITDFADREGWERLRRDEERAFVQPEEILSVTERWPPFRGSRVGAEDVRAWLTQFGPPKSQRLMFQLLTKLQFVSNTQVREWLRASQAIVDRELAQQLPDRFGPGRERRSDILVVRVGGPAKSGAVFSKLYADENSIYIKNVIDADRLIERLEDPEAGKVSALVIVDDFVGSGQSLADSVRDLATSLPTPGLPIFVVALLGFETGRVTIEKSLKAVLNPVTVHFCHPLSDEDRAFAPTSRAFDDPTSREEARTNAAEIGARIVTRNPLGWHDGQALIVFESHVPNNSLPILWAEGKNWRPLFPRFN